MTTNPSKLTEALRSRFRSLVINKYTKDDLAKITGRAWQRRKLKHEDECCFKIAEMVYSPRAAIQFADNIYDVVNTSDLDPPLDLEKLDMVLGILGFDKNGLNDSDKDVLELLASAPGGTLSLKAVSRQLHLDENEVTTLYEPKLLERGYIEVVSAGRRITPRGRGVVDVRHTAIRQENE